MDWSEISTNSPPVPDRNKPELRRGEHVEIGVREDGTVCLYFPDRPQWAKQAVILKPAKDCPGAYYIDTIIVEQGEPVSTSCEVQMAILKDLMKKEQATLTPPLKPPGIFVKKPGWQA